MTFILPSKLKDYFGVVQPPKPCGSNTSHAFKHSVFGFSLTFTPIMQCGKLRVLLCLPLPKETSKPYSSSHRGHGRKADEDEEQEDAKTNISSACPRSTAWGWTWLSQAQAELFTLILQILQGHCQGSDTGTCWEKLQSLQELQVTVCE